MFGFLEEVRDSISNANTCFKSKEIFNILKNYQGSPLGVLTKNRKFRKISKCGFASGASENVLGYTS